MSGRDDIDALEVMLASDGWAMFAEHVRAQVTSRENEILEGGLQPDRYVQAAAERAVALGLLGWPTKTLAMTRDQEENDA